MERPSSSQRTSEEVGIDVAPFLGRHGGSSTSRGEDGRRIGLQGRVRAAVRYVGQLGSRLLMREPSMLVRETAAERLDERQNDWAYSRPVVFLDVIWNAAFVIATMVVLWLSRDERPSPPLRVWIVGYAVQCMLHMVCVCGEYRRRHRRVGVNYSNSEVNPSGPSSSFPQEGLADEGVYQELNESRGHVRRLESTNTMLSFIWWIIGFYWLTIGGQTLLHDSPQLYWTSVAFLAFDVFFVVLCIALACVVGIAVCCCLPCIIAILYAVGNQEGASDEDINLLPKYIFESSKSTQKACGQKVSTNGGVMCLVGSPEKVKEHSMSVEDAECCICLSSYDDGVELRELPCNHHFHSACIDKWLHIHATCPLCKYNIIHRNTQHNYGA